MVHLCEMETPACEIPRTEQSPRNEERTSIYNLLKSCNRKKHIYCRIFFYDLAVFLFLDDKGKLLPQTPQKL